MMLNNNHELSKTADRKPLIGITMRYSQTGDFYLRKEYSEAIEQFGGVPVLIPLIAREEYIKQLFDRLDAILLPGSDSDVDPLRYEEEPHQKLGKVLERRDAADSMLIREAERRGAPILGICFGMQILNVARGGSLIQDIGSELPKALGHQQGEPRERLSHWIHFEAASILQNLAERPKALVNSHHHQAVKNLGANLKIVARASDGIIEAIEDTRENLFAVGVQWHPELNWENDVFSQRIFERFVRFAQKHSLKSESTI